VAGRTDYDSLSVPEVLIYGDSIRSPEMRHEVPVPIPDAFTYAEQDGARTLLVPAMEAPRVRDLGLEVLTWDELGWEELARQGFSIDDIRDEMNVRLAERLGISRAVVPPTFPLAAAERLRAAGVEVASDRELFENRRRVKNESELAGIRRAQRAAEEGMDVARELLRRGPGVTSEEIKAAIESRFTERGMVADEFIVSHGAQSAIGHDMGSGPIAEGEPVVVDLWPRDRETGCYADMTRTFCIGEPPAELVEWHALVRKALEASIAATKAGAHGRAIYDVVCDIFEPEGFPTQRTKEEGKALEDGFFHGLGHGVGLEVHEAPSLGITAQKELVAGDVVTIEPGLYRPGFGGVRLEDLVLVTEDGCENLTDYPYDLTP
jgi:Xaa-Pro aminopeptidase